MKAKVEFLWYQAGDEIKKEDLIHVKQWQEEGFIEESEDVAPEEVKEEIKEEVKPKPKGKKK